MARLGLGVPRGAGGRGDDVLAELGVSPTEEAVYRALVLSPQHGPDEIAAAAALPLEGVLAALSSLARRELVSESSGGQWVPVPPEQALELLIAREEEALATRRANLERTRAVIPEIVADYVDVRRAYVSDRVELLTDPTLVRSRLFQLTSHAQVSAWSISPGGALSPEAVAASLPLDRELAERGVECRMVVGSQSLGVEHWDAYLREITGLGHLVRSSASAFYRAIVIDGEYAVVPATGEARPGAYVLRGEALAAPVVALFEEVWSRSVPVSSTVAPGAVGPFTEARLRQVAHLMSLGLKDETVARRLGVSVRTVRRLIQATLSELGADGRFQAGVQAVQRGWVEVDVPSPD